MSANDFSDVKVGDKLWSVRLGECEVVEIDPCCGYTGILCRNLGGYTEEYYPNGNYFSDDAVPSLYWSRPEIIAPPRPKRKVTKTVEAWANVYGDCAPNLYPRRDIADNLATPFRIACVHLTGTYEVEE